jgi:hypothetical protein
VAQKENAAQEESLGAGGGSRFGRRCCRGGPGAWRAWRGRQGRRHLLVLGGGQVRTRFLCLLGLTVTGGSDPSNPDKSQDVWVLFDADKNGRIEEAFKKGKKKVVVDKERFVDLNDWQQKRKDDEEVSRGAVVGARGR